MKYKIFLITILVTAFVSTNFSQLKLIDSNVFYKANSDALRLMSERSRRIIVKTETIENGIVASSITKTEERLLPNKLRFLIIEKKGETEISSELIVIGTKEYSRENNGQWTVKVANGSGSGIGSGSGTSCIQYTEESDFINGLTTRKLKQLMINNSAQGLNYDDSTYWFDQQGLIIRSERSKGLLEPKNIRTYSIGSFEYDPTDLKIEAPIK